MEFTEQLKVYKDLFRLISTDENNEDQINLYLDSIVDQQLLKIIINIPNDTEETMLMWAVWNLKKDVVLKLIEKGANVHYQSNFNENCATYWNFGMNCINNTYDCNSEKRQSIAAEIAEILHNHGVDFAVNGESSYGLVKRSFEYNLEILIKKMKELGYTDNLFVDVFFKH